MKLLIYSANIHPRNIFSSSTYTKKSSSLDTTAWIASILPQLDNYPYTEIVQTYTQQAQMDVDEAGSGESSKTR